MQANDLETVTTHEPSAQTETCERQPYQAPNLVRLNLSDTEGSTGTLSDGITTS